MLFLFKPSAKPVDVLLNQKHTPRSSSQPVRQFQIHISQMSEGAIINDAQQYLQTE